MNFHDRPACRDCVHSAVQLPADDAKDTIRVCLRAKGQPAARLERVDGPMTAAVSGQCGVNGRFFVPGHR